MSWKDYCLAFVKKYGKAAKVVAGAVLNVVAPGSGSLVALVEQACQQAGDVAQDHWEESLLEATQSNAAELQRLGQLFELLSNDLGRLCDKALAFADQPNDLPDIIGRAIAADPSLAQGLADIRRLTVQFAALQNDVTEIKAIVKNFKPGLSYDTEEERDFLRQQREQFRRLPRARQKAADWSAMADRLAEAGLFDLAREEHENAAQAAQQESNPALAAAEHFKAYRAACEKEQWTVALASLRQAVLLNPQLAPFDWEQYELVEILGAGGFGTVFQCRDRNVHQLVAIKAIHTAELARSVQDVFKEAVLLTSLKHPSIIGVQTGRFADAARQRPYIIMEYFPSQSLATRLKRGPLPVAECLRVVRPVAEALRAAHHSQPQPIYHRDVKPDNLLLDEQGQVKVIDFGLAVRVAAAMRSTSTDPQRRTQRDQSYAGTLRYAPPEQKGESSAPVGPYSDIYGFGRTCCELLFGIPDLNEHPTKPKRHHHNRTEDPVPAELVSLLKWCLQPIPEDRPQDFQEVLDILASVAAKLDAAKVRQREQEAGETSRRAEQARQQAEAKKQQQAAEEQQRLVLLQQEGGKHIAAAHWAELDRSQGQHTADDTELRRHHRIPDNLAQQIREQTYQRWLQANPPQKEPQRDDTITNKLGMKFAWVPPGGSWLGGGGGKPGTKKFTLSQGLWCGVYPVTQAEWQAVMGNNPSDFKDNPRYPVESVSWNDVQKKFIEQLNQKTRGDGLSYRLPTEDEWEYICRGGPLSSPTQSAYHFYFARSKTDLTPVPTNDLSPTQANFDGNYPAGSANKGPYLERPSEVGLYLPNPLGIYDLHGNVWEWISSQEGSARVVRGGSWVNDGASCSASDRARFEPDFASQSIGFRLLAVPSS